MNGRSRFEFLISSRRSELMPFCPLKLKLESTKPITAVKIIRVNIHSYT